MSRILFAWELGGNFGHIGQFLPVAEYLRAAGHEVLFAVRHLTEAAPFLIPRNFPCLQSPLSSTGGGGDGTPESYPEILRHCGWGSVDELFALLRGWQELYRWTAPDVIIGSHAPTALLSARGGSAGRVALGTGFECPPRVSPMPPLRSWAQLPLSRLAESEAQVLAIANAALARVGCGEPATALSALLGGDEELLCTFPPLDHYATRDGADYLGALYTDSAGVAPTWPKGEGKRVFVYLRPHVDGFERLLADLDRLETMALVFAPGAAHDLVERFRSPHLIFSRHPVRIAEVAKTCHLAIGHGGHGMTAAFLQAGVPLLFLPTQLEQYQVAWSVSRYGAGRLAPADAPQLGFLTELEALLRRPEAAACAQSFRNRFSAFTPDTVAQHAAARIEAAGLGRDASSGCRLHVTVRTISRPNSGGLTRRLSE